MPSDKYLRCMAWIRSCVLRLSLLDKFCDQQPFKHYVLANAQGICTACMVQAVGAGLSKHQGIM